MRSQARSLPRAKIVVYFAPNTDAGFLDAINQAAMDKTHKPSVISISWGGPESSWTAQSLQNYNNALQAAAAVGVTVCVACGDNGSTDGSTDGSDQVDFPSSSPYSLACGGTRLDISGSAIGSEVVWNDLPNNGATGGGVSATFPLPSYQANANVPPSANPGGRRPRRARRCRRCRSSDRLSSASGRLAIGSGWNQRCRALVGGLGCTVQSERSARRLATSIRICTRKLPWPREPSTTSPRAITATTKPDPDGTRAAAGAVPMARRFCRRCRQAGRPERECRRVEKFADIILRVPVDDQDVVPESERLMGGL